MNEQPFYIIGHRGAPDLVPENTLPSFARAVEEEVNGIELDIHRIDNQLVVIHDDTVDRTSNGFGSLHNFTFDTLRELDFGNGTTIPTLQEVLEAMPTDILINIELKGLDTGRQVALVVSEYPNHQFMISSFRDAELTEFNDHYSASSSVVIALLGIRLTSRLLTTAVRLGAKFVNVSSRFLRAKKVIQAKASGLRVLVYTVNDMKHVKKFRNMGVAGVFTDNPTVVRSSLFNN